jgi:DNA-binding response OmpR family regulator
MRVLVVEDDAAIADAIAKMLARQRFAVEAVGDGDEGLERLLRGAYDVAIVDVMLPGRDGFALCRAARSEGVGTPILMLTARDAVEDRIRGLDAGADDYVAKPFAEDELSARLRALLRRGERPLHASLQAGTLRIDLGARTASVGERSLELGATEFRLLELFARNRGMALSRTQILEKLWDYDFQGSSNIVDVYVSQLRRKLKASGTNAQITTVWGIGYKLVAGKPKHAPPAS